MKNSWCFIAKILLTPFVICSSLTVWGVITPASSDPKIQKSESKIDQKIENPELRKMIHEQMWGRFPRGTNPTAKVSPTSPIGKEIQKSAKPVAKNTSPNSAQMPLAQRIEFLRYCAQEGRETAQCAQSGTKAPKSSQ